MIPSVIMCMFIINKKGLSLLKTKFTDFTVLIFFLAFSVLGVLFSSKIYTGAEKNDLKEIKIAVRSGNVPLKPGFTFSADGINFTVTAVDSPGSLSKISSFITLKAEGNVKKLNRLGLARTFNALIPEYKYSLRGPIIDENNN